MKNIIRKAKATFNKNQSQRRSQVMEEQKPLQEEARQSSVQPPSPVEILRYRYHHGTNLGSIFVLEQWLHPSMFVTGANGSSELDAVNA